MADERTGIKYIGKDKTYKDRMFGTGLVWQKGETLPINVDLAKEFLKHPSLFSEVPGFSYLSSTTSDGEIRVLAGETDITDQLGGGASDGTAGTGMTYTVTATDVGHRIYAWAQGTGSTSGNVTSPYSQQVTAGTSYRIDSVTLNILNPIVGQTLVASVAPYGATATITWYRDDDKILSYGATYTVQADDIGHSMYVWAEGVGNTTGSATSKITSEVKAN